MKFSLGDLVVFEAVDSHTGLVNRGCITILKHVALEQWMGPIVFFKDYDGPAVIWPTPVTDANFMFPGSITFRKPLADFDVLRERTFYYGTVKEIISAC